MSTSTCTVPPAHDEGICPTAPQPTSEIQPDDCENQFPMETIARKVNEEDFSSLTVFGGVQGTADALNTHLENGIPGELKIFISEACTAEGDRISKFPPHVVVGDIVLLNKADPVPADGLFIDGQRLELDDALNSKIYDQNPFCSNGEKVIDGEGRMLVTSVGLNTLSGEMIKHESPMSFKSL
ncbi:hypothetical protein Patl1_09686 [Pistacia atlantica]|uniref:Uncharacterized protein n=1 Tax=Pistacia atlantica TaxID=434234 RepID=A0ACC1A1M2_9ROSI|nr:hypothetical protein Patl1_09686 [Pistacia atlantica]